MKRNETKRSYPMSTNEVNQVRRGHRGTEQKAPMDNLKTIGQC